MYELLIKHGDFGLIAVFRGDRQNGSLEYIVLKNSWLRNSGRFSPSQRHAQCHSLKFAAPKTISDWRMCRKFSIFKTSDWNTEFFNRIYPNQPFQRAHQTAFFGTDCVKMLNESIR
jgi:hypothetical protein